MLTLEWRVRGAWRIGNGLEGLPDEVVYSWQGPSAGHAAKCAVDSVHREGFFVQRVCSAVLMPRSEQPYAPSQPVRGPKKYERVALSIVIVVRGLWDAKCARPRSTAPERGRTTQNAALLARPGSVNGQPHVYTSHLSEKARKKTSPTRVDPQDSPPPQNIELPHAMADERAGDASRPMTPPTVDIPPTHSPPPPPPVRHTTHALWSPPPRSSSTPCTDGSTSPSGILLRVKRRHATRSDVRPPSFSPRTCRRGAHS